MKKLPKTFFFIIHFKISTCISFLKYALCVTVEPCDGIWDEKSVKPSEKQSKTYLLGRLAGFRCLADLSPKDRARLTKGLGLGIIKKSYFD